MNEKPRMFQNPFSIKGRIRRLEYGISHILYTVYYVIASLVIAMQNNSAIFLFLMFPAFWFIIAQGAKRCHDRGNSGWYQIVPFYGLWMLFGDSEYGENYYGPNPKGEGNENIEEMIDKIGTPEI